MRKVRDIAPFGVRMPAELKELLEFEAKTNGRSLNNEIIGRLKRSLEVQKQLQQNGYTAEEPTPGTDSTGLSDAEKQVISLFRKLPGGKQIAILELMK